MATKQKRFGYQELVELLKAKRVYIRDNEWFTLYAGVKVMSYGCDDPIGYITSDCFYKLHKNGDIRMYRAGYAYKDYIASINL